MIKSAVEVQAVEKLYTVDEVAEYLRVSTRTVRDMLKAKKLIGQKIGRQYLVRQSDIEAFVRESWNQSDAGNTP